MCHSFGEGGGLSGMLILLLLSVSLVMVGGKMEVGVVEKEGEVSSEDWQIMAEEEEWNQKKEDRMADTKIAETNGEQVEEEEEEEEEEDGE